MFAASEKEGRKNDTSCSNYHDARSYLKKKAAWPLLHFVATYTATRPNPRYKTTNMSPQKDAEPEPDMRSTADPSL